MKADEREFLAAIQSLPQDTGAVLADGGLPIYVRDVIACLEAEGRMHRKRAWYLLGKWCDKGWYEYGVTIDMGWLTDLAGKRTRSLGGGRFEDLEA